MRIFRCAIPMIALFCTVNCSSPTPDTVGDSDEAGRTRPRVPSGRTDRTETDPTVCRASVVDGNVEYRLSTRTQTRRGQVVSLEYAATGSRDAHSATAEVLLDGATLMVNRATTRESVVDVSVDYGRAFRGIRTARVTVRGGTVYGVIDGREIVPMSSDAAPDSAQFSDGGAAPSVRVDPDVEAALTQVLGRIGPGLRACGGETSKSQNGHDSSPVSSWQCVGCWTGCISGGVVCLGAAAGACVAAGPFYAICFGIAAAACAIGEVACFAGCYSTGGPCCPVACGDVACCADGETCLNSSIGLCCSPGLTGCAGKQCCESTEVCLGTGPEAGTCCPATQVCGNTCCGSLESCVPGKGFCCGFAEDACGDGCCAQGEVCLGDELCCPEAQACGNTCCGTGQQCENPTLGICKDVCRAGSFLCNDGGCCPQGKYCSGIPGICCEEGEYYCNGACRPTGECIH